MGTTLTAAILKGKDLLLANVGDSRAYLIRGGFIRQLTIDHSWIAEAIRTGAITEEKARTHPYRGAITRSLGTHPDVEVDFFRERITNGDVVFLCSDGLYKVVGDEEIQSIVSDSPSSQEAVRRLIDLANQRGGPDDITAVVLRIRRALALRPTPRRTSAWPLLLPLAGGIATLLMAIYFVKSPLSPTPTPPIEKIAIEQMVATETPVTKPVISPTSTPLPTSTPVPPTSTPTPLPTTSPIPTSTPTPAKYPAPRLVVPEDGAVFGGYYVDLLWDWEGELKEDEWFDVRVWVGNIERSIGIVKEEKYTLTTAPSGSGEYRWRIVVVRVGPGGEVLDEVSEESEERRFTWNLPGPPPSTPTKIPSPTPTRPR
jgi:protein phosphatase